MKQTNTEKREFLLIWTKEGANLKLVRDTLDDQSQHVRGGALHPFTFCWQIMDSSVLTGQQKLHPRCTWPCFSALFYFLLLLPDSSWVIITILQWLWIYLFGVYVYCVCCSYSGQLGLALTVGVIQGSLTGGGASFLYPAANWTSIRCKSSHICDAGCLELLRCTSLRLFHTFCIACLQTVCWPRVQTWLCPPWTLGSLACRKYLNFWEPAFTSFSKVVDASRSSEHSKCLYYL